MNKHPTDPAQLAPWLTTPRTSRDMVRAACWIAVYRRRVRAVQAVIWFAGMIAVGVMLAWRG